jgi:tetratricopeptide (TPR) repeat protein
VLETRRGRHAAALPHFERALALNPNYADARRNLEATQREVELARDFLIEGRAQAEASGDPEALARVARACEAVGDEACARAFAERARRAGASGPRQGST